MTLTVKSQDNSVFALNGVAMSYYSDYNGEWTFCVPQAESTMLLSMLDLGVISRLERSSTGLGYKIGFKADQMESLTNLSEKTIFDRD